MLPSLIALRRTDTTRLFAWLALITFAIGAILARDLALLSGVESDVGAVVELHVAARPGEKRVAKPRPSGLSKRTAWSPSDLPDDDDETDEDSDTVAPSFAPMLPPRAFSIAPPVEDARLARFTARAFTVPIARRHATSVRGPPAR